MYCYIKFLKNNYKKCFKAVFGRRNLSNHLVMVVIVVFLLFAVGVTMLKVVVTTYIVVMAVMRVAFVIVIVS